MVDPESLRGLTLAPFAGGDDVRNARGKLRLEKGELGFLISQVGEHVAAAQSDFNRLLSKPVPYFLFDQGTPIALREFLTQHEVATAFERGWSKLMTKSELLNAAEEDGFDILSPPIRT